MKTKRIYLGFGMFVVAALIWQFYPEASLSETVAHAKEEGPESPDAKLDPGSKSAVASSLADRKEIRGKGTLLLRILGPEGKPVPGSVYWTTSPQPPATSSLMAPEHGYPLPGSGVMQCPPRRKSGTVYRLID